MARLTEIRREIARGELWVRPALAGVTGVALAVASIAYDRAGAAGNIWYPKAIAFGSVDDVRSVLTTVATTSLTVVTLLASLTLVALTFASGTVGPRQIRAFLRDRVTQATISVFIGTFVFCIVVPLAYRTNGTPYVPHFCALVALVLALVSTGLLVAYLHNVTRAIQPSQVLVRITDELDTAIREYGQGRSRNCRVPMSLDAGELECAIAELPDPATEVRCDRTGYLRAIDHDPLVEIADAADSVVRFRVRPGHFVLEGEVVADVWNCSTAVEHAIRDAVDIGPERTLLQDLEFALDQLAEVAIRALSPAINDTFTALACVNWMGEALRTFATADIGTPVHRGARNVVRVIDRPVRFVSLVTAAFAKVRQAGADNPAIVMRLVEMHARVGAYCNERQREALRAECEATLEAARACRFVGLDASGIEARGRAALEALTPGVAR